MMTHEDADARLGSRPLHVSAPTRPPFPAAQVLPGLRARDELVLDRLGAAGLPVCVVLAGGYAEDVRDTVDINAATAAAVHARARLSPVRAG